MTRMTTRQLRDAELAKWAEDGDFVPGPETPHDEAREMSRALLEAAGVDVTALAERVGRGRPTLEARQAAGVSPLWQVRAPQALDSQIRQQAAAEGRTLSQLLRDAASEYLVRHTAA
ncbi:MAG: ribbon-helix-helix protein, CopG family [Promicromonosporaceae bacterium]|nr:ribbon-helix-helix protein, CopG family [Promicromonosporaceae bacterium]